MIIKCPACGASASLDALIDDEPAAQALMLALKLTPVGGSLVKYMGLFRPAKRQLSWSRVNSLLSELTPMIEAQCIQRGGKDFKAPAEVWQSAIEKVIQARDNGKLTTPLKSHGYLMEVIITEGERLSDENRKKAEARKKSEIQAHEFHLKNLEKQKAAAEAEKKPKPRQLGKMPENVKEIMSGIFKNHAHQQGRLLTSEEEQQRRLRLIEQADKLQQQIKQIT